jgi:hypothetical protein
MKGAFGAQRKEIKVYRHFKSLEDLTGRKTGIIIYGMHDFAICDWSLYGGIPHVLSYSGLTWLNVDIANDDADQKTVEDIGAVLEWFNCIYDKKNEQQYLRKHPGKMYKINSGGYRVIVPDNWA